MTWHTENRRMFFAIPEKKMLCVDHFGTKFRISAHVIPELQQVHLEIKVA